jgi:hypothetical protein
MNYYSDQRLNTPMRKCHRLFQCYQSVDFTSEARRGVFLPSVSALYCCLCINEIPTETLYVFYPDLGFRV